MHLLLLLKLRTALGIQGSYGKEVMHRHRSGISNCFMRASNAAATGAGAICGTAAATMSFKKGGLVVAEGPQHAGWEFSGEKEVLRSGKCC